ncbi:hypothetical protein [Nocardia sp. NPDC020380]|uniref:hypothetical protein n=1 Tax=Nocardia sp. NPDC020380 TaxID=3364309 RepID=UPI0037B421A8
MNTRNTVRALPGRACAVVALLVGGAHTVAICGAHTVAIAHAQSDPATWYVSSGAPAGGTGSADSPFESLARAETAAQDGDTIVVQPVARTAPALDGGIALKPGQHLIGGGPAVLGASADAALPRITNTTGNLDGDAVRLAPGAEVRNLVIAGARRGGIYGLDAAGAVITGNDVSATNQECGDGFMIGPFSLPPTLAVGASAPPVPDFLTLNNGWAGIMTDFDSAAGEVHIDGNVVHDTACGDGIDLRARGTSRIDARISGNTVHHVNLGLAKLSLLALGVQADGNARLTAELDGNTQTEIASPATSLLNNLADSEGVFLNPLGQAHLDVSLSHNTFRNGYGNFSANGLEYVTTSGAPESRVRVTDSDFDTVAGDIIENYNLSTDGARQSLTLDRVGAHHSTFPGAALNPVVPANLGSCVVTTNFGRTAHTDLTIADSDLGDCSADGIGLVAYTPTGPEPSTAELTFDIHDTTLNGAAAHGINIINVGDTAILHGAIARTTLTAAQEELLRTNSSDGRIGSAALNIDHTTVDGRPLNCPITDPKVDLTGIPATC